MEPLTEHRRIVELCPYLRDAGPQKGDSWKNRSRRIYDHEFLFGVTGQSRIIISQREYAIVPGALVLIPPNTPHSFWVEDEDPRTNETYYAHFDFFYRDDYDELMRIYDERQEYIRLFGNIPLKEHLIRRRPVFENGYRFPEFIMVDDRSKTEQRFRKMAAAYAKKSTGWVLNGKALLMSLLESVYKQTNDEESYTSVTHREVAHLMKQYIMGNYFHKISAAEIAHVTGLSVDHASRIFKKITGVRLVEYIARYRVDKSRELMLERDLSLQEIALMVGFENEAYFSQTVKKYEGMSPYALRTLLIRELNIL